MRFYRKHDFPMLGLMALLSFNSKITAIEKEAYESPTEVQMLLSPNGLPSSVQIAGTIMSRRFPKFPILTSTKSTQQSGFQQSTRMNATS
jgi:hypothetical protein